MICIRTVIKINKLLLRVFSHRESEENLKKELRLTFVLIVYEDYCGTLVYWLLFCC